MKPFVRAEDVVTEAVVTATVSSSDSVKSITLVSLPFTVHAAGATGAAVAAAAIVVAVAVAAAGATERTLFGVSTTD